MKKRLKMQSDKVQAHAQVVTISRGKLIGVGAMVVVGLFGLLLAAQIVSPSSSAQTPGNTSCISDEAAAKTASQLGFYETRPTDEAWETEALQAGVSIELTASESAEVARGDNSWINAHNIEDCFDLVSTISRERIISLDKWLTGLRLWKYDEIGMSGLWMPAAEAEEYVKRLNAYQTAEDERGSQFEERRRQSEREAKQKAAQKAEREAAEAVEEVVVDNPPVLRLDHRNTVMTATARDDNLNPDSWQNAGPFAADPDCESGDLTYNPAGSDQYSLPLTAADNDQWYCFKVSDTGNNTGYVKYQVKGVFIEEGAGNNNAVNNENNPNQNIVDNEANNNAVENNSGRDNNDDTGLVSRQETDLGNNNGPQDQASSSAAANAESSESVATGGVGSGDNSDIPDTGIVDKQGLLQLLGVVIILVAVLGSARILIAKKRHQRT